MERPPGQTAVRPQHARLINAGGELIAEGPCWLDETSGQATLEPTRTPGMIQKERGELTLELESGRSLSVSDKAMVFRLGPPGGGPGESARRSLYRLRLVKDAQEATAAGAAGDGTPAVPTPSGRPPASGRRETPAAR